MLGDLWPLAAGTVTKPPAAQLLFVPQRPYLVLGSLRDQLTYPHARAEAVARHGGAAAAVLAREAAAERENRAGACASSPAPLTPSLLDPSVALDELLRRLLGVVDPAGSLLSQFALDEVSLSHGDVRMLRVGAEDTFAVLLRS